MISSNSQLMIIRLSIICIALLLNSCGTNKEDDEKKLTAAGVDESDVRTAIPNLDALILDLPSDFSSRNFWSILC